MTDKNLKIRAAEKKDVDALYRVANQLSASVTVDKNVFESHIDLLIRDDRHKILIAERRDKLVDYLSGYIHTALFRKWQSSLY